jgi:FlaG/FlaF family flagellin (archaellin)
LESESERISPSTTVAPSKSRFKLIAVVAIVAVSIVVGAFLVSAFISAPPPQGQDAWLFKGAYATYKGSMTSEDTDIEVPGMSMSFDFTVDFTIRLEVVDFNSTHALVSTYFQMSSSFGDMDGETVENETSAWVPLSDMGLMTEFEDVNLTNSYESTVNIEGFGTRNCMIYEYKLSDDGLAMTVYVDKAIGWPLKMRIIADENELGLKLALDIKLTETNIPALK